MKDHQPDVYRDAIRHSIRLSCAALAAFVLGVSTHLELGFWAPIMAVLALQQEAYSPDGSASINTALGAVLGAAVALVCVFLLPGQPVWTGGGLLFCTLVTGFLARLVPHYRLAPVTSAMVLLGSLGQSEGPDLVMSWLMPSLMGVGCAMTASVVLWPRQTVELRQEQVAAILHRQAEQVERLTLASVSNANIPDSQARSRLSDAFADERRLLREVRKGPSFRYRGDFEQMEPLMQMALQLTDHLQARVDTLGDCSRAEPPPWLAAQSLKLAEAIAASLRWLGGGETESPPLSLRSVLADGRAASALVDGHVTSARVDGCAASGALSGTDAEHAEVTGGGTANADAVQGGARGSAVMTQGKAMSGAAAGCDVTDGLAGVRSDASDGAVAASEKAGETPAPCGREPYWAFYDVLCRLAEDVATHVECSESA